MRGSSRVFGERLFEEEALHRLGEMARDVKITLVGAAEAEPSTYFGNYAQLGGLHARVATIEGRPGSPCIVSARPRWRTC